jgi:hypothetical protein
MASKIAHDYGQRADNLYGDRKVNE